MTRSLACESTLHSDCRGTCEGCGAECLCPCNHPSIPAAVCRRCGEPDVAHGELDHVPAIWFVEALTVIEAVAP